MRHVLGRRVAIAVVLVAFLPVAACGKTSTSSNNEPTPTSGGALVVSGRAHVTGTITSMSAGGASVDPIPTPFTFTVPDAGRGGLDLPQATVNGATNAIVWAGGRPLPVSGTCQLDVGEAATTVDAGGAHIALDGAVRALTAGTCAFGSSVAVGTHGISNPVDSVRFTLAKEATFTTSGGATVSVPAARRYEGRNGQLELKGPVKVVTEDRVFNTNSLTLTSGTWVVTVTSLGTPAVLQVEADLEGNIRATPFHLK